MRKLIGLFFISLVSIAFVTCDNNGLDCTNIDVTQTFLLKSKNGMDSLYLDSISKNMSLYYLTNGDLVKTNRNIATYAQEDSVWISIALNDKTSKKDVSYTCIRWGENDIDTIVAKVSKSSPKDECDYCIVKMQSYNDSIWAPTDGYFIFTIEK